MVKLDTVPTVFNDKQTITADPTNASYVYAVWDRLVFPGSERASVVASVGPARQGVYDGRGTTVSTRAVNCSNSNMKLRRKSSVPAFVTSPSSVMRPGVNWRYASGALI